MSQHQEVDIVWCIMHPKNWKDSSRRHLFLIMRKGERYFKCTLAILLSKKRGDFTTVYDPVDNNCRLIVSSLKQLQFVF